MSNIRERAGEVRIRVGGNTQETATLVDSLPGGVMIMKAEIDPNNPVSIFHVGIFLFCWLMELLLRSYFSVTILVISCGLGSMIRRFWLALLSRASLGASAFILPSWSWTYCLLSCASFDVCALRVL
jgi:hypothetical protein